MEQMTEVMFWVIVGIMVAAMILLFGKELLFNIIGTQVTATGG